VGVLPAIHVSRVLASADGIDDAPVLALPPLEKWPRTMWQGGAVYAAVQLAPYVGQFGVIAERDRADTGNGVGIVAGYRSPLTGSASLGFEIIVEQSSHRNDAAATDATATRALAGVRFSTKMDEKLNPFVMAGGGIYSLAFDGLDTKYHLSGLGFAIGGGVEYAPNPTFTLRAEIDAHVWAAAEESGHGGVAETLTFGLGAGVSF
jgi:opacity protein-like surface antigen